MFFKIADNNYIYGVGVGNVGTEISKDEYENINAIIATKPQATAHTDYRLTNSLVWEEYEVPTPPQPSTDVDDAEALNIILGGAE